jgi:hypothetical protein
MKRQDVLRTLARRLEAAAAADDWAALVRVDTDVAAALACLDDAWSGAERAALADLRAAHAAALRRCGEQTEILAGRLEELGRSREGWMAYALTGDAGTGLQ